MLRTPLTVLLGALVGTTLTAAAAVAVTGATPFGARAGTSATSGTSVTSAVPMVVPKSTPKRAARTAATAPPAHNTCALQTPGFHELSMTLGTTRRAYTVYAPASWTPARKVPAVYLFHGMGGDATGTIWGSRMKVQADQDGFLVVAPQALGSPTDWDVTPALQVSGSDAQLVSQLPATIVATWCVDPARQYATGYSAGSVLTHAMACYGGFPYVGYSGAAAQPWSASCPNPEPFDFVYFHGTADPYVPFGGNADVPSVEWSARTMAAKNGCEAQPTTTSVGTDVTSYLWSHCLGGKRQLVDVVEGGGHIWPGADAIPSLGAQTTTISADQVISDFWHLAP